MIPSRRLIPFLLCLALLFACKVKQEPGTPLAQVNDDVLTLEAFRSTFSEEQWNRLSSEQRKREIEDWVNVTLLAQEADRLKLNEEQAIRQRMDYAVKKVKANALIAQRLANITISEDQLFNYYRVHQADFQTRLMEYHVQRIFLREKNSAEILLKRIKDGYNFSEAVLNHSQENLRENLGNLGFVASGGADSLFWKAARDLKQNEPGLLAANDGFYILRWTEQREGSQEANFEEYRAEIRTILLRERRKQVYEELVRELKMKTDKVYYY